MNGTPLALGLAALAALASAKSRGSRAAAAARAPGALEDAAPGLGALRAAMVAVASEDTAYGKDYAGRADPLALHCGAVSHVVQRRYGGQVLSARVRGESHLWNRLPGGVEVDLSGSQYGGDGWHPLVKGRVEPGRKTVNPRFALFEERVREALGLRGSRSVVLSSSRRADFDDLAEAFRKRVNGRDDRVIDAMRTFAKKHKIGVLGAGAARAVFSVPEGALKLEMGWAPFTDNRNEALLWSAAPARVAEHLVPVLAHAYDHAWLLMPEVEIGGAVSVQAQGVLDACGLTDFKYHESNVAKDGRLVDYGYVHSYSLFKECRERGQAQRKGAPNKQVASRDDGLLRNRDGTPRVLYHQTAPQARQAIERQGFRIDKIRNRGADKEMPDGVFVKLTPDPLGVGGVQVPVTVRITNPLHVRDRDQLRDWLTRESPEYARAHLDAETTDWEHKALWEAAWNNPPKRGPSADPRTQRSHVEHMARLKQITDAWSAAADEASAAVRAVVTSTLLAHGYDSLWMKRDEGTRGRAVETIVVLDPRRVTVHHP